jgi:uncharacterized membrane protein YphA (DoxX/SURF4 family)
MAPFMIRLILGITLAYFAYLKIVDHGASSGSNTRRYGILEMSIALFLVIGLFTQLAAALNAVILIIKLFFKAQDGKLLSSGINYYVLLLTMAISLLFVGPGYLAIDLLF